MVPGPNESKVGVGMILQRRSLLLVFVVLLAGVALLGAGMPLLPAGAQTNGPIDCPTVMPVAALQKGMRGTGWSVVEGDTPQSFDVLVKGVLPDGMGPGRDLIVVELSGSVIDEYGGAWFGMSGSPVYVNGQLIGAVSAALSWGASDVVGLTPAEDMARLFDYPIGDDPSGARAWSAPTAPDEVPAGLRMTEADVARMAGKGRGAGESGTSFTEMKLPLSVSGATPSALDKLSRTIVREDAPFVPYAAGSASQEQSQTGGTLRAGGNFAAAMSYGDLTLAAVATTTMVCDGKAVAFGHPFFWTGATTLGANDATSLTIVKDPTFGSYKLAVIEENVGTVDQDRLAGVRATLGQGPERIPITSTVTAPDSGNTRQGRTDALLTENVPFLAPYHLFSNIMVTLDRFGEGSSEVAWTVTGTTESGQPFELTRSNMFASEYGIEWESVSELESFLYQISSNDFEEVTFGSVDMSATVEDDIKRLTITDVALSVNDEEFASKRRVKARPGDVLDIRVTLTPYDGTADRVVEMTVTVPRDARTDGLLEISGGSGRRARMCFYEPQACARGTGGTIDSFQELIDHLESLPRSNELRAQLHMGRRAQVVAEDLEVLDHVVSKTRRIRVMLPGASCCVGGGEEPQPEGRRPR
jgi:hypothetical protein